AGQLTLRVEHGPASLAGAVVERVLVQAAVAGGGVQMCRTRFLVSKLHGRHLDLDLPLPLSRQNLEIRLDGKRLPVHLLDGGGKDAEVGRTARLRVEPDLYARPVVLDVTYRADAGRLERTSDLVSTLQPP